MAMGNTYGVLLIICLMGNGLVALPRRLWQLGNAEGELIRLYLLVILYICIYIYIYMYLSLLIVIISSELLINISICLIIM